MPGDFVQTRIEVSWSGHDEIRAALETLPERVRQRALVGALRKAGTRILQAARGLVPKESGTLRRSLGSKVQNKIGRPVTLIVGPRRGFDQRVMRSPKGVRRLRKKELGNPEAVGTSRLRQPTRYSHLIEKGHGGPKPAPAHPFLGPAMRQNLAVAEQLIFEAVQREFAKTTKS